MRMDLGRWTIAATLAVLLSACNSFGRLPTQYSVHDLGIPGSTRHALPVSMRAIQVRAPSWLGSSAMQYRAADAGNLTRRAYVSNRWAAAPAEMVELALQRALPGSNPNGGGCVLAVDLDEFGQVFSSAEKSHALIEARLRLSSPRDDAVFAIEPVSIRVPAETPDAQGGARALAAATDQLAAGIAGWIERLDRELPGGFNGSGRCR